MERDDFDNSKTVVNMELKVILSFHQFPTFNYSHHTIASDILFAVAMYVMPGGHCFCLASVLQIFKLFLKCDISVGKL